MIYAKKTDKRMITLSMFLVFLGCFLWYQTSERTILSIQTNWRRWIRTNKSTSKWTAFALLILGLRLSTFALGITAGMLWWLFSISTLLGFVVIMMPLRQVNYKHVLTLMFLLFILEMVFKYASK